MKTGTTRKLANDKSKFTTASQLLLALVQFLSMTTAFPTTPLRPTFVGTKNPETQHLEELVYYATLAPSSHNTQCWKFQIDKRDNEITVLPDFERRTEVVDPDDHHLYVSLGCAVENLVLAAKARGYTVNVDSANPTGGINIKLSPNGKPEVTDLFEAIPKRQVSRCEYDGKSLKEGELDELQKAGTGQGVRVVLVTDANRKEAILEQIIKANTAQMSNPKFKKELGSWIRYNERDAVANGDGLYGKAFGNPAAPAIVGHLIFKAVARPSVENAKVTKQVRSSAGFAVFVSEIDDPVHWVEAGRCYERFALRATAMGVRNAMLNMPVEEADVRPEFSKLMGLAKSERPDLLLRFGRGPEMPVSPRRQVEDVILYK